MSRWDTVLFDLDGTLTDPKEGITKSAAFALRHFGIDADPDSLTAFIGPPLNDSFSRYFGLDPEQCVEAVRQYRVRFSDVGWAENIPYPGIRELLDTLRAQGMTLLVATSKPEVFARRILEHFGLADCFADICGITMSERETMTKADVIRLVMARNGVDPASCVMVGDRLHDVEGGHEAGLPVVGVLYGYGSREELEAAGADFIAADTDELEKLLIDL
ncbi:MAG: HAD family hydrolase [Clostridia bacterium]|nr:HAD family hydrolase [Clostridia bacterium]